MIAQAFLLEEHDADVRDPHDAGLAKRTMLSGARVRA
jgi:hypothetical protein